ncbi:MAG: hypothetical protein AAGA54_29240, partial [Myxococcota bacterium]
MKFRMVLGCWVLVGALAGCSDDTGADTDTDGGSSTSGMSDPTDVSTTASGTTATTTSSTDPTLTTGADSSSSSDSGADGSSSDSGADETSTGEAPAAGICVGFNLLSYVEQIHTMGGPAPKPGPCGTKPTPCGGDPTGTWDVASGCGYEVLPNFFDAEICEGAVQEITGSSVTGTRTFGDDGTYSVDLMIELQADVQFDSMACAGIDCETFADFISMEDGFAMTCADGGDATCDCSYTLTLPEQGEGTWDEFDDGLLLNVGGETQGIFPYCVDPGLLTVWTPLFAEQPFPDLACDETDECENLVEGRFDAVGCEPLEREDE